MSINDMLHSTRQILLWDSSVSFGERQESCNDMLLESFLREIDDVALRLYLAEALSL